MRPDTEDETESRADGEPPAKTDDREQQKKAMVLVFISFDPDFLRAHFNLISQLSFCFLTVGETGESGIRGSQGPFGPRGLKGEAGRDGIEGFTVIGRPGKSFLTFRGDSDLIGKAWTDAWGTRGDRG